MPATMAPAPSATAALAARASAVAGSRPIAKSVVSGAGATRAGRGAAPARAALSVSSSASSRRARRGARVVASAADEDERAPAQADDDDEFTVAGTARRVREAKAKAAGNKPASTGADAEGISGLNPVNIGRKSRQFVDGVFKSISGLTQFTRAPSMDEAKYELYAPICFRARRSTTTPTPTRASPPCWWWAPPPSRARLGAQAAAARLHRQGAGAQPADAEAMPTAVQTLVGDVADAATMERAVAGVNKVVYCARAKTLVSGELGNVDELGVRNAVKSLQDYNNALAIRRAGRSSKTKTMLTNFVKHRDVFEDWTVDETRLVDPGTGGGRPRRRWRSALTSGRAARTRRGSRASSRCSTGSCFQRRGVAQIPPRWTMGSGGARGEVTLREHDGVLLRLRGTERYSVSLREPGWRGARSSRPSPPPGSGRSCASVFAVPPGGVQPRVQRGRRLDGHGLGAGRAHGFKRDRPGRFAVRSEEPEHFPREIRGVDGRDQRAVAELVRVGAGVRQAAAQRGRDGFHPGLLRRRAHGGGRGQGQARGEQAQRGEDRAQLRPGVHGRAAGHASGGAGGSKALVFDQGSRITMPISCADVADVCLRALHDEQARNKSFDVCYEYSNAAGGDGGYEKIAQVTGTNDNYLTPALAVLEKNT